MQASTISITITICGEYVKNQNKVRNGEQRTQRVPDLPLRRPKAKGQRPKANTRQHGANNRDLTRLSPQGTTSGTVFFPEAKGQHGTTESRRTRHQSDFKGLPLLALQAAWSLSSKRRARQRNGGVVGCSTRGGGLLGRICGSTSMGVCDARGHLRDMWRRRFGHQSYHPTARRGPPPFR